MNYLAQNRLPGSPLQASSKCRLAARAAMIGGHAAESKLAAAGARGTGEGISAAASVIGAEAAGLHRRRGRRVRVNGDEDAADPELRVAACAAVLGRDTAEAELAAACAAGADEALGTAA